MKKAMICIALVGAMALGGCDKNGGDGKPAAKTDAKQQAKPAAKKNVNQPVEDAMMQIPPQMRESYQQAFSCEVKRNKDNKDAKAINVTPEYVRGLVARLKENANLAKC